MYFKAFLKKKKIDLIIFAFVMILGWISSYILINGPASWGGPVGVIIAYLIRFFWEYRKFKRDTKESNEFLHNRRSF